MARHSKKNLVLKQAFKLFLVRGYDAVSFTDIEEVCQVSRGLIFHHFENKQDLFKQAIDAFIFDLLDNSPASCIDTNTDTPLKSFLDCTIKTIQARMVDFIEQMDEAKTPANFFKLVSFLKGNYPGLEEKVIDFDQKDIEVWSKVLKLAMEKEEVKPDIDVLPIVSLFRHVYIGLAYRQSLLDGLQTEDLRLLWEIIYLGISLKS